MRIRCFLIDSTEEVEASLRRYHLDYEKKDPCPLPGRARHSASVSIGREPVVRDEQGYICNSVRNQVPHDDPRWPTQCECGYVFREEDEWRKDSDLIYRRADTGEAFPLRSAPAGAMWYAPWLDDLYTPQGEHNLMVMTPGGEWCVDGQASNCTMKEDFNQKQHHCWVRSGTPPDVTAGKDGPTCSAGAGSIQCREYHGFLRNGYLEDA